MKARISRWFRQRRAWFLGLFAEVRTLRKLESEQREKFKEYYAKELEHRKAAEQVKIDLARKIHELEQTKRDLSLMTEARLNADRAVEILHGEMSALREVTAREIHGMKQTVDCFALQLLRRQVYGTAPLNSRSVEELQNVPATGGVRVRNVVRNQMQEFVKEAEARLKKNQTLEGNGPEYSSTSHAQDPVAVGT